MVFDMVDFNCFSNNTREILDEKELIEDFVKYSKDGDCIKLPTFTELFGEFRTEMWNYHPKMFYQGKPFTESIYEQSERKYPVRASMIGRCPKFIFLDYHDGQRDLKIPKNPKENHNWKNAANLGTFLHGMLQRDLSLFGIVEKDENGEYQLETEIKNDKMFFTGHADFVGNFFNIYGLDLKFVGEIKTTGSYQLDYSNEHFHKIDKIVNQGYPVLEHLPQGNLYMSELGIDYQMFYYTDRGNTNLEVAYLVKKSRKLVQQIKTKLTTLKKHYIKKTLPTPKSKSQDRCKYCRYVSVCDKLLTIKDIDKICGLNV